MVRLLLLFVISLTVTSLRETDTHTYKTDKGEICFYSKAPIEDVDAKSKKMYSAIETGTRNIACAVNITSFEFDKSLMKEHFNEKYMESEKFPKATYAGIINEAIDFTKPGTYKVTSTGKLKIHGVEQQRTITGTIVIDGELNLKLTSEFKVKLEDHNIKIPTLLFEKIAEVVDVKINASYQLN